MIKNAYPNLDKAKLFFSTLQAKLNLNYLFQDFSVTTIEVLLCLRKIKHHTKEILVKKINSIIVNSVHVS